jgi:hypothetical protein
MHFVLARTRQQRVDDAEVELAATPLATWPASRWNYSPGRSASGMALHPP